MPAPNSIVSEVREALAMPLRASSCVGAVWGVRVGTPRALLALPGVLELLAERTPGEGLHGKGFAGVPAVCESINKR